MAATLKVVREIFGIELRRGTFTVSVDDNNVGTIKWHGSLEVPIEPGQHVLKIKGPGRYSSRPHTFDVAEGETASFRCHGVRFWPLYLASAVKPDLAINIDVR